MANKTSAFRESAKKIGIYQPRTVEEANQMLGELETRSQEITDYLNSDKESSLQERIKYRDQITGARKQLETLSKQYGTDFSEGQKWYDDASAAMREKENAYAQRVMSTQAQNDWADKNGLPGQAQDNRTFTQKAVDAVLGDRTQVTNQKTDWLELAKGALSKGAHTWNSLNWKTVNFLFGGIADELHALGTETINGIIGGLNTIPGVNIGYLKNSKSLIQRGYEDAQAGLNQATEKYAENAVSSRAAQIVDKFGTSTVAAIPLALEAIVLAPTQAAQATGAATTAGLEYFSGLQGASGMAATGMMAKEGLKKMIENPQFWTSYLQVAGDGYESALEDGMSQDDAAIYGLVNGFFNAMVEIGGSDESLGGIQNLPMRLEQARENGSKRAVVEWFKDSVLGEGKEEVLQGLLERGFKAAATPDNGATGFAQKWFSLDPLNQDAVINPFTAANEFVGGAAVGAILGGGQVAAQNVIDNTAYKGNAKFLIDAAKKNNTSEAAQLRIKEIEDAAAKRKNGTVTKAEAGQLYQIANYKGGMNTYVQSIVQAEKQQRAAQAKENAQQQRVAKYMERVRAGEVDETGTADTKNATVEYQGRQAKIDFVREGNENRVRLTFDDGSEKTVSYQEAEEAGLDENVKNLIVALSAIGPNAPAAYSVYDSNQEVGKYAAAMDEAINLYAAQGQDVRQAAKAAKEAGSTALITYLNDAQLEMAQSLGAKIYEQKQTQVKEAGTKLKQIRQQAQEAMNSQDKTAAEGLAAVNTTLAEAREHYKTIRAAYDQTVEYLEEMAANGQQETEAYQNALEQANYLRSDLEGTQNVISSLEAERKSLQAQQPIKRKKGTVSFDGATDGKTTFEGVDPSKLNKKQSAVVDMVKRLADVLDIDFVFFQGPAGTGGFYRGGNTIYININSGMGVGDFNNVIAAGSLSHELTHWLQEYAPEEYEALRQFIVNDIIEKRGADTFERLVQQQMNWEKGRQLSRDAAIDEVVANACQTMLRDSSAITELAQQNKSLAEKIRDFIQDLIDRIKAAFEDIDISNKAAIYDAARAIQGEYEDILKLWDDALRAAAETGSAVRAMETETQEDIPAAAQRVQNQAFSYEDLPPEAYYTNSRIYDYDFLTAQKSMQVVTMPKLGDGKGWTNIDRDDAVNRGIANAASVGTKISDTASEVENTYTHRKILIGKSGIEHSLGRKNTGRYKTNARIAAVAGEVVKNGIPINGLKTDSSSDQVKGTYALATLLHGGDNYFVAISTINQVSGNLEGMVIVDVTHAINGRIKRDGNAASTAPGSTPVTSVSKMSIADFLDVVNETHRSILSQNVLDHFGEKRPTDGYYSDRVLYQQWDTQHNNWAPEFYSKMDQTITDWTNGKGQKLPEKMAASQVVGWLKGKGVKDEEIKWSGIVPYLQGKKTVTQAELQAVMAGNETQIQTKTLEDRKLPEFVAEIPSIGDYIEFEDYSEAYDYARRLAERKGLDPNNLRFEDSSFYYIDPDEFDVQLILELQQPDIWDEETGEKIGSRTHWKAYTLPGGQNYREIMFQIPGMKYENRASRLHWRDDAPGTIAHARVQDMTDEHGVPVLFVEEIQSDLHNAGASSGFTSEDQIAQYNKLMREARDKNRRKPTLVNSIYYALGELALNNPDVFGDSFVTQASIESWIDGSSPSPSDSFDEDYNTPEMQKKQSDLAYSILTDEQKKQVEEIRKASKTLKEFTAKNEGIDFYDAAPDVPFAGSADTYHEYIMKHILRMAAEGGYGAVGWTTAQQQVNRWSDEYAEGYRIEYDQNIPKFMRKYGKQWGATVQGINLENGEEVWGMYVDQDMADSVLQQGQPRFQMWDTVEETDKLVAVHNKSVSGLRRMLDRNGVPFPSIAIKKAGTSHEGFGDVSIVFPRSTIDPEVNRQNRLYSNDAWTPTEPIIEYDVGDTWRYQKKLRKILGDDIYTGLHTSSYLEESDLARKLQSYRGDVFETLNGQSALRYAYLKSIGQEPDVGTTENQLPGRYKNSQYLAIFSEISEDEIENARYENEELRQKIADILEKQFESQFDEEKRAKIQKHPIYTADKINVYDIQHAFHNYKNDGYQIKTVPDYDALDRYLKYDRNDLATDEGYKAWILDQFKDLIVDQGIPNGKDYYTPSGNPRSFKSRHIPATMENIVAQMLKEQERGNGVMGINLRGAATKSYRNVEEMRAESGKLLGKHIADDVYDSYMSGFYQRLHDMSRDVILGEYSWEGQDSAEEILLTVLRDARSKQNMDTLLQREARWIKYSPELTEKLWQLREDVQNMPAPYFEAKPRRVVYPGEALAYILPDNADQDVVDRLNDLGYRVLTYKAGDEADRLEKLNSVTEARFQRWDDQSITDESEPDNQIEMFYPGYKPEDLYTRSTIILEKDYLRSLISNEETDADTKANAQFMLDAIDNPANGTWYQQWDFGSDDNQSEAEDRKKAYTMIQAEDVTLKEAINGLNAAIAKQKTTIGKIQERLKLGKTKEVRESDAKRLAKQLITKHNSVADVDRVAAELKALGDYILQQKKVDADELKQRARLIASEIVENAEQVADPSGEETIYRDIASDLKGKKLTIDEKDLGELDEVGGYESFRRANFGNFTLAKRKTGEAKEGYATVSSYYKTLQQSYGQAYFPDETGMTEGDMVQIMASFFDLAKPEIVNPYEQYLGEATEELANSIVADALDGILRPVSTEATTKQQAKELGKQIEAGEQSAEQLITAAQELAAAYEHADSRIGALKAYIERLKQGDPAIVKELDALRETVYDLTLALDKAESHYRTLQRSAEQRLAQVQAEGRARQAEIRAEAKAKANAKVKATAEHYKEMAQRARERRKENAGAAKYRAKIQAQAKKLTEWLLKNSDKEHVPEAIKAPLLEFLMSIDFTSKRALGGGLRTQNDMKFGARLQKLQQMLANQQSYLNGDGTVQEDLGGYIDISPDMLQFLRDTAQKVTDDMAAGNYYTINRMSATELRDLSNLLSSLTRSIRNMNNLMANERYSTVREAASQDIEEMERLGKAKDSEGGKLPRLLKWKQAVPFYAFKRYGKGGQSIFDGLTRGWEKLAFHAQEIIDFTEKTYTDKEVNEWKKDIHNIELSDGSRTRMTTAQIMELAMLYNRDQAQKHLRAGGMRIGNIDLGRKGAATDTKHYHLTAEDINKLFDMLTSRQLDVAYKLQKFMANKGAEWGNEISMRRFGYNFYTEGENYYPIKTDALDRPMADTDAQENSMFRLLNLSSSKSLNPKASNALVVGDIFDTFADHMADQAKLNALGLPILDAIKWFNFKERIDLDGGAYNTRTMQAAMEQAYGDEALKYFRTLIKDVNGVTESGDRGTEWLSKTMSNYKIAAVGANLRVALLQPTAYVRAQTVLTPRNLLRAFAYKNGYKEAMKYSGTAVWKSLGYYDTNISRSMRQQIQHNETWKDKVQEKSMTLAEKMDEKTWGRLWVACKLQAQDMNPSLTGEALMQEAANLFRAVVYSSQVMDGTLTRSELMRGKTQTTKALTAFMAEPTLSYNVLLDAYSEYTNDIRKYGKSGALKRNQGKLLNAFAVYTSSAVVSAIAESIADAIRDDDDYESFLDKFLQALFGEGEGLKRVLDGNLVQDLLISNKIPYAKNIISKLIGFGNSVDMSTEGISTLIDAINIWIETMQLASGSLDKATKTTYYGRMEPWGKVYKSLQALSQLTGFAVSAALRDVFAIWNTTLGGVLHQKVKTYDAGAKSNIFQALDDGTLDYEEAVNLLVSEGIYEDADKADNELQKHGSQLPEISLLLKYIGDGNDKAAQKVLDSLNGRNYSQSKRAFSVRNGVEEMYAKGDMSYDRAMTALVNYAGMSAADASKRLDYAKLMNEHFDEINTSGDSMLQQGELGEYLSAAENRGEITHAEAVGIWEGHNVGELTNTWKTTYEQWQKKSSKKEVSDPNNLFEPMALPDKITTYDQFKSAVKLYSDKKDTAYQLWESSVKPLGIDLDTYTKYLNASDSDGNGSIKQDELGQTLTNEIYHGQLSLEQARAIWQTIWNSGRSQSYDKWAAKHGYRDGFSMEEALELNDNPDRYNVGDTTVSRAAYEEEYVDRGLAVPRIGGVYSLQSGYYPSQKLYSEWKDVLEELNVDPGDVWGNNMNVTLEQMAEYYTPEQFREELLNRRENQWWVDLGFEEAPNYAVEELHYAWQENPDYPGESFEEYMNRPENWMWMQQIAQNESTGEWSWLTGSGPRTYSGTGTKAQRRGEGLYVDRAMRDIRTRKA